MAKTVSRKVNKDFLEIYRDYLNYKGESFEKMHRRVVARWNSMSRGDKYAMSQYMAIKGIWGPLLSKAIRMFDGTIYFL